MGLGSRVLGLIIWFLLRGLESLESWVQGLGFRVGLGFIQRSRAWEVRVQHKGSGFSSGLRV